MSTGDTGPFWEAVDDLADFVHEWADGCRNGDRARDAIATIRDLKWGVIERASLGAVVAPKGGGGAVPAPAVPVVGEPGPDGANGGPARASFPLAATERRATVARRLGWATGAPQAIAVDPIDFLTDFVGHASEDYLHTPESIARAREALVKLQEQVDRATAKAGSKGDA